MIVDSSALLAILNREPHAKRFKEAILIAARRTEVDPKICTVF